MRITAVTVENVDEGTYVTVKGFFEGVEEITADDAMRLQDVMNEAANGVADDKPAAEEKAPARRGRPAKAKEEPEEEEKAPARRRRATVPADDGISDEDLVKACSKCVERCADMKDLIVEILNDKPFHVKTTGDIPQDQRQLFLDTIEEETKLQLS